MIQDIATVFWRDWIVLRHRLLKFILSRMVAPVLYMVHQGVKEALEALPAALTRAAVHTSILSCRAFWR